MISYDGKLGDVSQCYFESQELLSNGLCRCPSLQEALTAGWGAGWSCRVPVTSGSIVHTLEMRQLQGIDRNLLHEFLCFFDGLLQLGEVFL